MAQLVWSPGDLSPEWLLYTHNRKPSIGECPADKRPDHAPLLSSLSGLSVCDLKESEGKHPTDLIMVLRRKLKEHFMKYCKHIILGKN